MENESQDIIPEIYASSVFVKDSLIPEGKSQNDNSLKGLYVIRICYCKCLSGLQVYVIYA